MVSSRWQLQQLVCSSTTCLLLAKVIVEALLRWSLCQPESLSGHESRTTLLTHITQYKPEIILLC